MAGRDEVPTLSQIITIPLTCIALNRFRRYTESRVPSGSNCVTTQNGSHIFTNKSGAVSVLRPMESDARTDPYVTGAKLPPILVGLLVSFDPWKAMLELTHI